MGGLPEEELPAGGHCDLKALATEAGVSRSGSTQRRTSAAPFGPAPTRTSRTSSSAVWTHSPPPAPFPDPRQAQIERLRADNADLRQRLTDRETRKKELTDFKTRALFQLAAQHDEIETLQKQIQAAR